MKDKLVFKIYVKYIFHPKILKNLQEKKLFKPSLEMKSISPNFLDFFEVLSTSGIIDQRFLVTFQAGSISMYF